MRFDPPTLESYSLNPTPTSIHLRPAIEADLPAIVAIYNESVPGGRATADTRPISVDERIDWFHAFTPHQRPLWVAEEGGRVVGCVYLTSFYGGRPAYHKTAEISFYLSTACQRKGIGSLMVERMIQACPGLGVTTLIAMHFDHNEATLGIMRKFGFRQVGHLPEIAEVFGEKRGLLLSILRV